MGGLPLLHLAVPTTSVALCKHRISWENFDSAELVSSIDTATATAGSPRGERGFSYLASVRRCPLAVFEFAHKQSRPKLLQSDREAPIARHFAHVPWRWQVAEQVQSRPRLEHLAIECITAKHLSQWALLDALQLTLGLAAVSVGVAVGADVVAAGVPR